MAGLALAINGDVSMAPTLVKRGIAPKSVLFSRNARRFNRSDLDAWCAAGRPNAYASKGEPGAVRQ